jgi:hypothetical protein
MNPTIAEPFPGIDGAHAKRATDHGIFTTGVPREKRINRKENRDLSREFA